MYFLICQSLFYILSFITDRINANPVDTLTTLPASAANVLKNSDLNAVNEALNGTRRIIHGEDVYTNRPYMVYLKLPSNNPRYKTYKGWLCGGVIVHEEYILTSAACIEDAKHFYIVSGTYRHTIGDDKYNNPCINNGAKKAIWKCVPRNYIFDGHENDNLRWMNNDIAVVKVEDEFDFNKKIKGCDYVPKPICYNNQTKDFERPGTEGSIAGWGSIARYKDWVNARREGEPDEQDLLYTRVEILDKKKCKTRWGSRYHNIIENYMICTKDAARDLSQICNEKYVDCRDIFYESEEQVRRVLVPKVEYVHSANHNLLSSRKTGTGKDHDGGFCENDHGGPLIYGKGPNAIVIGIISACLVKENTNKCYGPFLYTSVWKNRKLINCAIFKSDTSDCAKVFRGTDTHEETYISWADHPDGPAKSERKSAPEKEITLNITSTTPETSIQKATNATVK